MILDWVYTLLTILQFMILFALMLKCYEELRRRIRVFVTTVSVDDEST